MSKNYGQFIRFPTLVKGFLKLFFQQKVNLFDGVGIVYAIIYSPQVRAWPFPALFGLSPAFPRSGDKDWLFLACLKATVAHSIYTYAIYANTLGQAISLA